MESISDNICELGSKLYSEMREANDSKSAKDYNAEVFNEHVKNCSHCLIVFDAFKKAMNDWIMESIEFYDDGYMEEMLEDEANFDGDCDQCRRGVLHNEHDCKLCSVCLTKEYDLESDRLFFEEMLEDEKQTIKGVALNGNPIRRDDK